MKIEVGLLSEKLARNAKLPHLILFRSSQISSSNAPLAASRHGFGTSSASRLLALLVVEICVGSLVSGSQLSKYASISEAENGKYCYTLHLSSGKSDTSILSLLPHERPTSDE